jgi:hypothetical protein
MLALLFTRLLLLYSFHAVHISYGDITIAQDSMKGSLTFFKDDWAKATEHWYGRSMSTAPKQTQDAMELEYLKAHVRFWNDGFSEQIRFSPSIKEDAGQSVTYEFTSAIPMHHRTIIIDSRAVLSEYSDQMNLLTVKIHDESTNLVLTNDHPTATIKL